MAITIYGDRSDSAIPELSDAGRPDAESPAESGSGKVDLAERDMKRSVLSAAFVLWLALVCASHAEAPLKKVSMLPHWIPQAQFAGYMVAVDKGFYRDEGLDMELLAGGPARPVNEALRSGKATFCVDWLTAAIQERASGVKLVNLAQVVQRSALILVARSAGGIESPGDLDGKKVGIWPGAFTLQPKALFRKYHLDVKIVPNYTSMDLFLKGGVDAIAAMWYNEYHLLLNSGIDPAELTLIFFKDRGLDFPEDGLYTMEETFRTDPAICKGFVKASLRGWLYAFRHKEEALDLVMKRAKAAATGTNRVHQRWMLNRMEELILPDHDRSRLGKLRRSDYRLVGDTLLDLGMIKQLPRYADFYRGKR
jgi:NitT/TauT family transport system substrate-binding protein